MKRKKSNLPVVEPDTMYNIEHRLSYTSDRECYQQEMKQLKRENPVVARFIRLWATDKTIPKSSRGYIAFCGMLVYRMLASQAEADKLKEEMGM